MWKKTILCRPMGGLNDLLCQIEACWRYAESFDRSLVIDTEASGLLDDFSNYFVAFETKETLSSLSLKGLPDEMYSLPRFPAFASPDRSAYAIKWSDKDRNFVEDTSDQTITFDFGQDYSENLLIHHQCGGGAISVDALRRLSLTPEVLKKVRVAVDTLPEKYSAIHVRNTDLKTDYQGFFETKRERFAGKDVLICSDDRDCIDFAREFFENSIVHTVSDIPRMDGGTLHMNPNIERRSANIDMLVDLLCLANAQELHLTQVARGFLSGYSRLAKALHEDRDLLARLLGGGTTSPLHH